MVVCVECKKEMRVNQNGLGVRYGNSHVYAGDKYVCPECGKELIVTNKDAVHDPERKINTVQMNEE